MSTINDVADTAADLLTALAGLSVSDRERVLLHISQAGYVRLQDRLRDLRSLGQLEPQDIDEPPEPDYKPDQDDD